MALRTTVLLAISCFLAVNNVASYRHSHGVATSYSDKLNYIDLELLQSVCQSNQGNVLISPASVKTLLGLLLEGAGGNSAKQLRNAMRLDNEDHATAQLHKFQLSLQSNGLGTTELTVANRAFLTDKASPNPQYERVLQDNYNADVQLVNMAKSEETANAINSWVRNKTNGLIPTLIEPGSIDSSALLVLTNAIYFHALWETAFEPRNTGTLCFKSGPICHRTRMMEVVGYFRYASKDFGQIIEMEYKDKRYTMVVVLPRQEDGVDLLVRDLPFLGINSILSTLNKTEVWVTLPRFALEFDADLVPNIKQLGVKDVFDDSSNLSEMVLGNKSPVVSKVFHKARIQVTEEGAAAGAASGALVVPLMGSSLPRFAATHPFLFFIRDVQTNGLLFAGRLSVPDGVDDAVPFQPSPPSSQPQSTTSSSYPHSSFSQSSSVPPSSSQNTQSTSYSPTSSINAESTETTPGGIPLESHSSTRPNLHLYTMHTINHTKTFSKPSS